MGWVCPYFTQNWVKTTQHFLECTFTWSQIRLESSHNIKGIDHFEIDFGMF